MEANIVIITPIPVEYSAVRKHLHKLKKYQHTSPDSVYEIGLFKGKKSSHKVALFQKGKGTVEIVLATKQALDVIKPKYIFLVGTAAGIRKVKLGDIVIGTKGYHYESGREQTDTFVPTPKIKDSSESLVDLANIIAHEQLWQNRLLAPTPLIPKVVSGPIASGDKVLETKETSIFSTLQKYYPDTVALEMEAYGFLETASKNNSVQRLIIRSISDFMADKKSVNQKGSREVAAANAAAFIFEVIAHLPNPRKSYLFWWLSIIGSSLLLVGIYALGEKYIPTMHTNFATKDTSYQKSPSTTVFVDSVIENKLKTEKPEVKNRIAVASTFSVNIPLQIELVRKLEQQLNSKYSYQANAANKIEFKHTGDFVQNDLDTSKQLYYYSGGYLNVLVNGQLCCCIDNENFRIETHSHLGNKLNAEKNYVEKLVSEKA